MPVSYHKCNSFAVAKPALKSKFVPLQLPQIIALELKFNERLEEIENGSTVAHDVDCMAVSIVRAHHYGV